MKPIFLESPWDSLKCPRCGRAASVSPEEWEKKIVKCIYCSRHFRITNISTVECHKCQEFKTKWIETRKRLRTANKATAIRAMGWKLSIADIDKLRSRIQMLEAENAELKRLNSPKI